MYDTYNSKPYARSKFKMVIEGNTYCEKKSRSSEFRSQIHQANLAR